IQPNTWRLFAIAAAAATVVCIAFALVLQFQPGGDNFVTGVDDIGEAVAALLAAAACAWTASRSEGSLRRGWLLMAASAAAWCLGEIVWSVYEVGLGVASPFPSAADIGFLLAMPLAVAGVLSFWTAPRGTSEHWRLWLDGLTIALALTFTGWSLGLQQIELSPGSIGERAIGLAYPMGDILVATILILAIRRATRIHHARLLLLLGGLAANAIADSVFAYMTAIGNYPTLVIDTAWVVGYLMIALAALWPARSPDRAIDRMPIDLWQVALPWAAVLTAGISALVVVMRGQRTDQFQTELAVAIACLLLLSEVFVPWLTIWRTAPHDA
ncbi:MAG: diguanylate cyclase, partial [Chloroflexota bacterium]|nr:diguanylate cyclase [Chloroflexota bacterium]